VRNFSRIHPASPAGESDWASVNESGFRSLDLGVSELRPLELVQARDRLLVARAELIGWLGKQEIDVDSHEGLRMQRAEVGCDQSADVPALNAVAVVTEDLGHQL
jgi:hypothetical protein